VRNPKGCDEAALEKRNKPEKLYQFG